MSRLFKPRCNKKVVMDDGFELPESNHINYCEKTEETTESILTELASDFSIKYETERDRYDEEFNEAPLNCVWSMVTEDEFACHPLKMIMSPKLAHVVIKRFYFPDKQSEIDRYVVDTIYRSIIDTHIETISNMLKEKLNLEKENIKIKEAFSCLLKEREEDKNKLANEEATISRLTNIIQGIQEERGKAVESKQDEILKIKNMYDKLKADEWRYQDENTKLKSKIFKLESICAETEACRKEIEEKYQKLESRLKESQKQHDNQLAELKKKYSELETRYSNMEKEMHQKNEKYKRASQTELQASANQLLIQYSSKLLSLNHSLLRSRINNTPTPNIVEPPSPPFPLNDNPLTNYDIPQPQGHSLNHVQSYAINNLMTPPIDSQAKNEPPQQNPPPPSDPFPKPSKPDSIRNEPCHSILRNDGVCVNSNCVYAHDWSELNLNNILVCRQMIDANRINTEFKTYQHSSGVYLLVFNETEDALLAKREIQRDVRVDVMCRCGNSFRRSLNIPEL